MFLFLWEMSFYKGHAGDSEHLVVPLFVREDILLFFDLLRSYDLRAWNSPSLISGHLCHVCLTFLQ